MNQKSLKRYLLPLVILLVVAIGIYWASRVSFVEISVTNFESGKNISYQAFSQSVNKLTQSSSTDSTSKMRVSSGGQEVTVTQNGKSYFEVLKTKGFLEPQQLTQLCRLKNKELLLGMIRPIA